jgi:hypothetical protein
MRWLLVLGTSGCVIGSVDQEFVFDDATAVSVEVSNGSLEVSSSGDDSLRIAVDGGGIGRGAVPEVTERPDGTVVVDMRGGLGGGDVLLALPAGMSLDALIERGDISAALESPSSLDLCVAAGDASIGLPAGGYDLDLDMGAGDISAQGIWQDDQSPWSIGVCVGAGSVDLYVFTPM